MRLWHELDPETGRLRREYLHAEWLAANVRDLSDDVLIRAFLDVLERRTEGSSVDALVDEIWYRPSLSGDEAHPRPETT